MYQKKGEDKLFENVEEIEASLTKYIVYGTHLNMDGKIVYDGEEPIDIDIVLKTIKGEEQEINIDYEETKDGYSFSTSDKINEGINLEELSCNKKYVFLRFEYGYRI